MSLFTICLSLAVLFAILAIVAPLLEIKNPDKYFFSILAAVFALMPMIFDIAKETHDNSEASERIHDRIGVILDISREPQKNFINDYAADATAIEKFQNPFLSRYSLSVENDFRGKHSKLAQGVIEVPANRLMSMAMALISEARTEILATSVFSTDWNQRWSPEYWQLQKDRMKQQHITLNRIFILNGKTKEECEPVFREHAAAGVKVSFIDASQVSPDENKDLVIIDGSLAAELVLGADNRIVGGRVFVDSKQVNSYRELFQNLEAKAQSYKPH
jgi:hypothetical protein